MTDDRKTIVTDVDCPELREFGGFGIDDDESIPLDDFIAHLTAIRERIAPAWRDKARFRVWCAGDYATAYLEVQVVRPETDGEYAARKDREAKDERERKARAVADARAQYERLKAIFEGGNDDLPT